MRELAVQSANDTNTSSDRASLQAEVTQLQSELNRIADTTTFNGKKLLDGSFSGASFHVGANENQVINFSIGSAKAADLGTNRAILEGGVMQSPLAAAADRAAADDNALTSGNLVLAGASNGKLFTTTVTMGAADTAAELETKINSVNSETGITATATTKASIGGLGVSAGAFSFSLYGSNTTSGASVSGTITSLDDVTAMASAINNRSNVTGIVAELSNDKKSVILTSSAGDDISIVDFTMGTNGTASVAGVTSSGSLVGAVTLGAAATTDSTIIGGYIQLDSAESFTATPSVTTLTGFDTAKTSALEDVADITVLTQEGANNAISVIDGAINMIDRSRGDLGAIQNRFESTIANLNNVSENLSAARSRILDADIAQETSAMTKNNILQQAGVSILAQANQAPQLALSLLQ
jgi:flagellin